MEPKLRFEDLKLGQDVKIDQLSEIYDVLIFLGVDSPSADHGEILFIGRSEADNLKGKDVFTSGRQFIPIFNDSTEGMFED